MAKAQAMKHLFLMSFTDGQAGKTFILLEYQGVYALLPIRKT